MGTNISKEISDIKLNRYGVDIRMPIHDALAALAGADAAAAEEAAGGFPVDFGNPDISAELAVIQSGTKGSNVKDAIYSALYKLSLVNGETNYISAGLTPRDMPVETLSQTEYSDRYHAIDPYNLLESIANAITQNSPLFGKVEVERFDEENAEIRFYEYQDLETPFVKISEKITGGEPEDINYWYRIFVYGFADSSASEKSVVFSYPDTPQETATYAAYPWLEPWGVYVNRKVVCIRLGGFSEATGYIVFSRTDSSRLMVSLNCGYEELPDDSYGTIIDPSYKIRSYVSLDIPETNPSEITRDKHDTTDILALSSIIVSQDGEIAYSPSVYAALTSRVKNDTMSIVRFGDKDFVLTNSFMFEA